MTYCPRDCDNTKCRRNIKSNPLECNFSYYGDFSLCKEYKKDKMKNDIFKLIQNNSINELIGQLGMSKLKDKYIPKVYERYLYVGADGEIYSATWLDNSKDRFRFWTNNVFKYSEHAIEHRDDLININSIPEAMNE